MRLPPARSLLWRSLRTYQVYGANTDVGKTIVTTLLCRAARRLWQTENTTYLKPVSTGPAGEADDRHIRTFAPGVTSKTLFQYDLAVSPHIAAQISNNVVPSDETLLAEVSAFATRQASQGPGWLFVETAGGVHSPSPSGSTQADLYMPLRLPVILIGDSKLGGISQTISAFESLKLRGYDVETIMLFQEAAFRNHDYLVEYFTQQHGIPVETVPKPPPQLVGAEPNADIVAMSRYYDTASGQSLGIHQTLRHLDARHNSRIARLESMSTSASSKIWYPFTQQKHLTQDKITVIDSARGDYFQTFAPLPDQRPPNSTSTCSSSCPLPSSPDALLRPSFDGSASWWTQGLGHGNPHLALTAAYAAGRYGHVMFAEAVHEPALALAEALLAGMGGSRLERVFFSDNGSTAVEVAIKMALGAVRARYGRGHPKELRPFEVLGLKGSYHGDTIGAMDCSEPSVFNEKVEWYEGKGFWFDYPVVEFRKGRWNVELPTEMHDSAPTTASGGLGHARYSYESLPDVFDLESREARGEARLYEEFITTTLEKLGAQGRRFGALIIEPVVLGAGGMLMVDPLFQKTLVEVVRRSAHVFNNNVALPDPVDNNRTWTGLPVIFDEVFTGLYRLGRFSAASFLGVDADISVHAKLLTGGLVPLSVTLTSDSIFRAFESDDKSDALLHGHSYTAHAVGCQVALESIREMQKMEARGDWDWAKSMPRKTIYSQREPGLKNSSTPENLVWSVWSTDLLHWIDQLPGSFVGGVWALGTVLAIRLTSADGTQGYKGCAARGVQSALMQGSQSNEQGSVWEIMPKWNVHTRVLGNTLYVMAGLKSTEESIRGVEEQLRKALLTAQDRAT
ncbi:pyridoxal phosphate-dependent transferase [Corynascus similis CBS 632.67]